MKKYLFILFLLMAAVVAQANENDWVIFEPNSAAANIMQDISPPTIVGEDDREEITNNPQDLERAVVLLDIIDKNNLHSYCSGAMVGSNIVLTAAHCVEFPGKVIKEVKVIVIATGNDQYVTEKADNPTNKTAKANMNFKSDIPSYTLEYSSDIFSIISNTYNHILQDVSEAESCSVSSELCTVATAISWCISIKYMEDASKKLYATEYDYAIITLDKPIGDTTGWFDLKIMTDEELKNSNIVLISRPGDKPKNTLWKSKGDIGHINPRQFKHNADTIVGSSGGPILLEGNPYEIAAINIAQDTADEKVDDGYPNIAVRINQNIIDAVIKRRNFY